MRVLMPRQKSEILNPSLRVYANDRLDYAMSEERGPN